MHMNFHTLYLVYRGGHDTLQFQQPLLHLAPGLRGGYGLTEGNNLSLTAPHVGDVQFLSEGELGYALKTLLEMRLDSEGRYRYY